MVNINANIIATIITFTSSLPKAVLVGSTCILMLRVIFSFTYRRKGSKFKSRRNHVYGTFWLSINWILNWRTCLFLTIFYILIIYQYIFRIYSHTTLKMIVYFGCQDSMRIASPSHCFIFMWIAIFARILLWCCLGTTICLFLESIAFGRTVWHLFGWISWVVLGCSLAILTHLSLNFKFLTFLDGLINNSNFLMECFNFLYLFAWKGSRIHLCWIYTDLRCRRRVRSIWVSICIYVILCYFNLLRIRFFR